MIHNYTFPPQKFCLGEVKFDQDQTVTFEFTNKGFNPLVIDIHLVCKYNELGNHRESIVISNDPQKFKMIYVSAKVIP